MGRHLLFHKAKSAFFKVFFLFLMIFMVMLPSVPSSGLTLAESYKHQGNYYYNQKQFVKAIEEFSKAINENPDYGAAYFNRALSYYSLHLYFKAIVDFDMAIMMDPEDSDAYLNRGLCYGKVDKLKLALADINKARDLGNRKARNIIDSGELHRLIKESRAKQQKMDNLLDDNRKEHNRLSEVTDISNEYDGATIKTTFSKGDPMYDGGDGVYRQLEFYDKDEILKKTEIYHTAAYIEAHEISKTTVWYEKGVRISKKAFTYTGKLLNHTGIRFYDENGKLIKKQLLDKHGKEVPVKK